MIGSEPSSPAAIASATTASTFAAWPATAFAALSRMSRSVRTSTRRDGSTERRRQTRPRCSLHAVQGDMGPSVGRLSDWTTALRQDTIPAEPFRRVGVGTMGVAEAAFLTTRAEVPATRESVTFRVGVRFRSTPTATVARHIHLPEPEIQRGFIATWC